VERRLAAVAAASQRLGLALRELGDAAGYLAVLERRVERVAALLEPREPEPAGGGLGGEDR
jgi:hypothetical protein